MTHLSVWNANQVTNYNLVIIVVDKQQLQTVKLLIL